MATGAGKTYTAITSIYRLLKFAKNKRVLFLVDTKNLGEQAEQEMMSYTSIDDNRKLLSFITYKILNHLMWLKIVKFASAQFSTYAPY